MTHVSFIYFPHLCVKRCVEGKGVEKMDVDRAYIVNKLWHKFFFYVTIV